MLQELNLYPTGKHSVPIITKVVFFDIYLQYLAKKNVGRKKYKLHPFKSSCFYADTLVYHGQQGKNIQSVNNLSLYGIGENTFMAVCHYLWHMDTYQKKKKNYLWHMDKKLRKQIRNKLWLKWHFLLPQEWVNGEVFIQNLLGA